MTEMAAEVVAEALIGAYDLHEALGEEGAEVVQTNQFGDTALKADIGCEKVVIDALEQFGQPVRLYSEEHGVVDIHLDGEKPSMIGILDGLDGSNVYKKQRGVGHYGTMFALFEGSDPTYDNYLAAGIMQHATGRLLLATKGKGLSVTHVPTGSRTQSRTSDTESIGPDSIIYIDNPDNIADHPSLHDYFTTNRSMFVEPLQAAGFHPRWLGASAAYYAAVVLGEATIVGEGTRKGNLEIATAYGMIKEAGGVMMTLDGQGLGPRQLLTFGQETHIPVLTASNPAIACKLLSILTR